MAICGLESVYSISQSARESQDGLLHLFMQFTRMKQLTNCIYNTYRQSKCCCRYVQTMMEF